MKVPKKIWGKLKLEKQFYILGAIAFIAVFVGIAAVFPYFYFFSGPISGDQQTWGVFGDYVGGILNPTFAFFSFIALLYTVLLQTKEIHLSTQELARSARALKEQSEAFNQQNFESTFFQLLSVYNDIIENMQASGASGRATFEKLYGEYSHVYQHSKIDKGNEKEWIIQTYERFYSQPHVQSVLGNYFRNVYHIFKFVDGSMIGEKKKYTSIIRAQLSPYELDLFFYNCLTIYGERFVPLIETYQVFEHLDLRTLINPSAHLGLYKKIAYGANITFNKMMETS